MKPHKEKVSNELDKKFKSDEFKNELNKRINIIVENVRSEMTENEIEDETSSKDNNTLIVPAGKTMSWIKKYKIYFFPEQRKRTFKETEYIAFYHAKAIQFVGKFEEVPYSNIKEKLTTEMIDYINIFGSVEGYCFYKLKDTQEINIKHNHPYAFVQNRRYVNYNRLINAETTDNLIINNPKNKQP